jgi:hypothetical protein
MIIKYHILANGAVSIFNKLHKLSFWYTKLPLDNFDIYMFIDLLKINKSNILNFIRIEDNRYVHLTNIDVWSALAIDFTNSKINGVAFWLLKFMKMFIK